MDLRVALTAFLIAAAPFTVAAAPASSDAAQATAGSSARLEYAGGPDRRDLESRDCRPYNGPYGYFGNPWCDDGFKYEEDLDDGRGIVLWSYPEDPERYRWKKRRY